MTGTMTYERLRIADPYRWRLAAAAWRGLADWAGWRSAELIGHAAALAAFWSGAAARAADRRLTRHRLELDAARVGWWATDQVLSEFAGALDRARRLLDDALATAGGAGLVVDPLGRVRPLPDRLACDGGAAVAAAVTAIRAALTVAADADAEAARRLTDLAAGADVTAVGAVAPVPTPPCDAEPAAVRRWWGGLTPAQQRWLIVAQPGVVGRLDGVPASARDAANRLRLAEQHAAVDRQLAHADGRARQRLERLRAGLQQLTDRLASVTGPRAYLLALDVTGDGRAVVALGDPDRADNVLTHVPGMTAGLASLDGELDRAARVADRAGRLAAGERTAAVLWLDYNAPDFLGEAAGADRAQAGARLLHRFQDGLRATHEGVPAHQAVLGHSYGSLVVGTAAAQSTFAADSVVFVGSPGVGVDSAAALQVPPGQVWSTTSRSDPIQYAAVSPGGLIADMARVATVPLIGGWLAFGSPEDDLWHGRNPSSAGFGARTFDSQLSAGHVGYWATDGPALDNLARITLGGEHHARVR